MANFDLGNPFALMDLESETEGDFEISPETAEYLAAVFEQNFEDVPADNNEFDAVSEAIDHTASSVVGGREIAKMKEELKKTDEDDVKPVGRFKTISNDDLNLIEESRQSKSTKRSTNWGVKTFQEWCVDREGQEADMRQITADQLNEKLRVFYAEAAPKNVEKRAKEMPEKLAAEYHKNSFKSLRAAINRHLHDLGRDIDIVRDREFRTSNNMLDGKLKLNVSEGASRPTCHKPIINDTDLEKISTYLYSDGNPVILLRLRVWFILSVHFVSRGLEFHKQLALDSFEFKFDENNREYVVLNHETKQKNRSGGLESAEAPADKRMYATSDERCPVKSLKTLIRRTDPEASSLFNHCSKDALKYPEFSEIWYTKTPVKPYQFTRFMGDISKNAQCSRSFTAHCLRATSIPKLNDAGYELRHIMYMTGHKNEGSIRSYNRECSTAQKMDMSDSLASVIHVNERPPREIAETQPRSAIATCHTSDSGTFPRYCDSIMSQTRLSNNISSSGLMSPSSFSNCTFNFGN